MIPSISEPPGAGGPIEPTSAPASDIFADVIYFKYIIYYYLSTSTLPKEIAEKLAAVLTNHRRTS
jgi:hypothetical protein